MMRLWADRIAGLVAGGAWLRVRAHCGNRGGTAAARQFGLGFGRRAFATRADSDEGVAAAVGAAYGSGLPRHRSDPELGSVPVRRQPHDLRAARPAVARAARAARARPVPARTGREGALQGAGMA